ncbi:hypothetical protein QAD02_003552 [Eretmocerus hayati]|uniref:Uncharacterized protein n=1 Tax=Eretmocerus hayati TaxID=131215 RepID=A0ACC2NM54_9HYME|nr:hypothetical protein QAD02_003552 [Eretmocerus hayati]
MDHCSLGVRAVFAATSFRLLVCAPAPGVLMGLKPWKQMPAPVDEETRRIFEAIKASYFSAKDCCTQDGEKIMHRYEVIWISPDKQVSRCDLCNKFRPMLYNNWAGWMLHVVHQLGRKNILEKITAGMTCSLCSIKATVMYNYDDCKSRG